MSFDQLGLHPTLLQNIQDAGYKTPTEIQQQAVPAVIAGNDLMASAQTGSGKTAAFLLPTIHKLIANSPATDKRPRVLILAPTRELALQIQQIIKQFSRNLHIRHCIIVGGSPYEPQIRALSGPLDIVVATPGRLIDHLDNKKIDLSGIDTLILDEADRMLDMGFIGDVNRIAAETGKARQTLLFSATLDGEILQVANALLKNPVKLQLSRSSDNHDNIMQSMHQANDYLHKRKLLNHVLADDSVFQAVIFTSTKRAANNLADQLKSEGQKCAALHGDMKQAARRRTVDQLRHQNIRFLVATDVAARGLDVKNLTHVINFDMPNIAEDYVHRIGRTGRAGTSGTAVSLVGPQDWAYLASIEKLLKKKLQRNIVDGLEPDSDEPRNYWNAPKPTRNKSSQHATVKHKRPRVHSSSATGQNQNRRPQY